VSVSFGGIAAPLLYVSPTQINCVVPYEAANLASPWVQVTYGGAPSNQFRLSSMAAAVPGIFAQDGSGKGAGAIIDSAGALNGPDNPAAQGSIITFYMTGEGQTNPAGTTGLVTQLNTSPGGPITPQPLLPVGVTIGGQPATVTFYGEAPGMVSGVLQVNVQVPTGLPSGSLPIIVSVGSSVSQSGLTILVK
jgi:uncharacterized protein (TIGR03437 family)